MSRAVAAALAILTAATLLIRTAILDSGFWIDEAITVGIASHDVRDIPDMLRLDGSPPLFYLLLHGWMALAGTGEGATRAPALLFALLAGPGLVVGGSAVFGPRAGTAERVLAPAIGRLPSGRHVLLVWPVSRRRSQAPWNRAVRIRTREWRAWLRAAPGLRAIGSAPRSTWPRRRSRVRAELFQVR